MKANSRRRVLISSLAMLMVALVALSTATFAWFTQSTTATADQISVKTVKSSELLLAKTTGEWTDQLHYNYTGKVLKPASSADGTNWYAATAADKSSAAADAKTVTSISSALDGYVFKEQLNVSNNGQADVDNVTISFSLTETEAVAGAGYVRVALVPADKRGAEAKVTADDFRANVYAAGEDTAQAITGTKTEGETTTIQTAVVDAKDGAAGSINIGKLTAKDTNTSTKYFNLYVWFEGQDADCKDANAGNEMPEITFSVTGDTVETTEAATTTAAAQG